MANISITRRHRLSHKKAKEAAAKIAEDLNERFNLDYEWDGDDIVFERLGLSGQMEVGKTSVTLEIQLGFLLTPLRGRIEQAINQELDELFGKA